MMRLLFLLLIIIPVSFCNANFVIDTSFKETAVQLVTSDGPVYGTLLIPESANKVPVAVIVSGSGPTDRNGNSVFTKNNSLQKLAEGLAPEHIASLRFDKRGVGESKAAIKSESTLRFENYVDDVKAWVNLLKKDKRFSQVIIIGHSEGSLIGMAAAERADKFVSVAGPGRSGDQALREQFLKQPQQIKDAALPILDSLSHGKKVDSIPPMLFMLFRPSVQPYLVSWFKYQPAKLIAGLKIPVLILQGEKDLQVTTEDAKLLAQANKSAKLVLISTMNHVLKDVGDDKDANSKTYNDPGLPVNGELIKVIAEFITGKNQKTGARTL